MLYEVISETPGKPVIVSEDEDEKQNTHFLLRGNVSIQISISIMAAFRTIIFDYGTMKRGKT